MAEAVIVTARHSGAFTHRAAYARYYRILGAVIGLGVLCAGLILAWDNPMPVGSDGFWTIARMRATSLVIMLVVAFSQAIATVSFQTAANNRIITPSIMGFEALYTLIQTTAVFFMGVSGVSALQGTPQFLAQVAVMVLFAAALYGWLLGGAQRNIQVTLLIGIVIGGGLGALATFMRRLLSPSEFDVLTARLIGSIANADSSYLAPAVPLVIAAGGALWWWAGRLNAVALGRDTAVNIGVNHRAHTLVILLLVAVLISVSTALVGPMTFYGFLVAMIAYQLADTYDHRYVFPMAVALGFAVFAAAYFTMKHIFFAQGSVGIIIEILGGTFFLVYVMRKGRL